MLNIRRSLHIAAAACCAAVAIGGSATQATALLPWQPEVTMIGNVGVTAAPNWGPSSPGFVYSGFLGLKFTPVVKAEHYLVVTSGTRVLRQPWLAVPATATPAPTYLATLVVAGTSFAPSRSATLLQRLTVHVHSRTPDGKLYVGTPINVPTRITDTVAPGQPLIWVAVNGSIRSLNTFYLGFDRNEITFQVFQREGSRYSALTSSATGMVNLSALGVKPGADVFVAAQDRAGNWSSSQLIKVP